MVMLVRLMGVPVLLVSVRFVAALVFFLNDSATTEIYALSLHDALPISVPVSDTDCGLPGASSVMVTVAARPPVAAGGNLTGKAQPADAATRPPAWGHGATPEPATAKSPGFEPARAMLVMLRVAVPLLVRVTRSEERRVGKECRSRWSPDHYKKKDGTIPVPASDTDCGLPGASSVMVTVAVRAPVAVGVNVTVKAKLDGAGTGPLARGHGATPEPATAKSPGFEPARAMLVMLRVAVPLLVRVTVCSGLVVLRRWSPKPRLVGAMVTAGAMPIPASDTDCGLPGASSVMVTVAVRAPVAAGVKLMLIAQLAPGATEPAPVGQVLPAAKAKSAACAPVMVMLVRFSGGPPLLVSVRFCAALVVPTR